MNNTCLRCMTASAGTIIRRDFSFTFVILLMKFRLLQQMLSSVFGVAGSGFRPWTKILDCCLPLKSGSFSTPVRRYCLSTPLSLIGLVSLYPTNYHPKPCHSDFFKSFLHGPHCPFSHSGIQLGSLSRFSHRLSSQCLTTSKVFLLPYTKILSFESSDLQCLKRANSVRSEPEPNSHSHRYI
jgi:hypothetical protein